MKKKVLLFLIFFISSMFVFGNHASFHNENMIYDSMELKVYEKINGELYTHVYEKKIYYFPNDPNKCIQATEIDEIEIRPSTIEEINNRRFDSILFVIIVLFIAIIAIIFVIIPCFLWRKLNNDNVIG
jgi:ABC-type bacteriocin/lantibiotic exporter with double-glycine peptidase domain